MKIAVVMGGYSDESVISLRSGQLILNHLNKDIHEVYEVHILNEGWYVKMGDQKLSINRADFSFIPGNVAPGVLFRKPDHFENYDDWPFFWGQNEGTIAGNTGYLIFGSAFKNLVK